MKKTFTLILISIMALCLTGCTNEYKGYWCTYDETATIVVLFEDDYKEKEKLAVAAKIDDFENVESISFYTKEDYAEQMGLDPSSMDIYETYIVTFNSMESVGTYVEQLGKMNGVHKAEQSYAKNNIAIYNLGEFGKYTYTNSDEAKEEDLETGKYKEKDGVIIFSPDNKEKEKKMLYPKDEYLCGDAACNKIYAKSNATCTSNN